MLGIRIPESLDATYKFSEQIPKQERPVVFIGPYEHHSNELTWRESIADVVVVPQNDSGLVDLQELERKLVEFADRPLKIGSFSAASNVTGIISDTEAIAVVLHKHGALAFFDYAGGGPYLDIDFAGSKEALTFKDAVFVSPHKFVGGPGSPGLLIVRR